MKLFQDKVVLITGGTRGIGLACAAYFAKEGAQVALCGRDASRAQEAAETISDTCLGLAADISNPDAASALVKSVTAHFGALHILVNNAGVTHDGLLMRMTDEQWRTVMQTNLDGVFYLTRAVSRVMIRQRFGRIINIGSVVGLHGQAGQCNYAAAKAGLVGFTKACARELAPRHITVNLVAPGFVETDMTAAMTPAMREEALKRIPLNRSGLPEDIAPLVAFLASDQAAYITGTVIPVDGGLGM
ncbi:MAG: 3-oxoacyl-[acyl-carrier-protein] reductase [Candidatus Hydrogenedentales bacterium]